MEHCIQCEPHYIRNYFQIQINIFIYQTDVFLFFLTGLSCWDMIGLHLIRMCFI